MSINKPFHRTYRPNKGNGGFWYIVDREYARAPDHYVRAFLLIQDDLKRLFEFVEPSDLNLKTYSFRIHELLIRTCIEIEANFKAILLENTYLPVNDNGKTRRENVWNIDDYRKINKTHHLSSYKVMVPSWNGKKSIFQPFDAWKTNSKLPWYVAYNQSKHNRHVKFIQANFNNLMNAVAGLVIILSSQFNNFEFSPIDSIIEAEGYDYHEMETAIGRFFRIEYPKDWGDEEKYDFNWAELKKEKNRFEKINYNEI